MNKYGQYHRLDSSGFTLLELMMASMISVLLIFTLMKLLSMSFMNAQISKELQSVNFSGLQSANLLTNVVKKAGYEGCKPSSSIILATGAINATPAYASILIDGGTEAFPLDDFTTGALQGYQVTGSGTYSPSLPVPLASALTASAHQPREGTDILAVYYASQSSEELSADVSGTDNIELVANGLDLKTDEYVFIGDCRNSAVLKINSMSGTTIQHSGLGSLSFDTEATVRRAIYEVYFVGDSGRTDGASNTIYSLYRLRDSTVEEMIPNVSLLRFRYGVRTPTGEHNFYDTFAAVPDPKEIVMIQAGMLVLSEQAILPENDPNNYDVLGVTVPATDPLLTGYDKFYKKTFTLDVMMRNGI